MNDVGPDISPPAPIPERAFVTGGQTLDRSPGYGSSGYPSAPVVESSDSFASGFFNYLRIINKRKKLIASIAVSAIILGYLFYLLIPPVYTATVRLQVDPEAKIVEKGDIGGSGDSRTVDYIRTQVELLQSRNMADRVAALAKLTDDSEHEKSGGFSLSAVFGGGSNRATKPARQSSIGADTVLGERLVKPVPQSRLIDVSITDPSPRRAQAIANAYGEAFINFNLDKRLESNAYAKTFLDDQIKQLKIRLQDAEKAMIDFAQKEQLIAANDKTPGSASNYEQVSSSLNAAKAERIKNELQWRQVEAANAINLPQLLTNGTISTLRSARGALMADYQEKSNTYGPGYPAMMEIKNKIAEIDRQIAAEVKTIKASYKAAYEASVTQEAELKKHLETTRTETLDTQKRSIQFNILKREVDTTRTLYESLLQRYKEVDVASGVGVNNVFIVDRAQLPGVASFPVRSSFLKNSAIAGILLGVGLALLLERLDDVVHSTEEAEAISGLTVLGVVPKMKDFDAEMDDPRSAISESYRSLCTTLQLSTANGLPKSLLMTSSSPSEGKSVTSVSVARYFSTIGLRVLLIDADLRNASLARRLGADNSVGLSNYLTSGCSPSEAIQRLGEKQLFFMPSGPLPPNSADLLSSVRMQYLIDVTARAFDLVVVDGPPLMGLADAPLLTRSVNATVFVLAAGQTRKPICQGALRRLTLARANVIGLVLTKADMKSHGYGYGYGYGYGAGNRDSAALEAPKKSSVAVENVIDPSHSEDVEVGEGSQNVQGGRLTALGKKIGGIRGRFKQG